MQLFDVNVLVYAHKTGAPDHPAYASWLSRAVSGPEPFALAAPILSGFLRVVTHPRIFDPPSSLDRALAFVTELRRRPTGVTVSPGARHWTIFEDLCRRSGATGNLIPDAYLAALAIETGCEWVTADRGFARFPGLRWRHPLG